MTIDLNMKFTSKLPITQNSIFSHMSELAFQHKAINLSQGFPDFETDPGLIDLVTKYMKDGFNQYAPMAGYIGLRERIASKYSDFYQVAINPDSEITITAGGTQALFTVISAVIEKGDEVVIFEPAYDSYKPAIELMGGKVIPIKLTAPEFDIDWEEVRRSITPNTKLIIINNPSNPTGRMLNAADILELESIVLAFDLLVLSDEVYEHIVFDGNRHCTLLSSEVLRPRSFVVCSFGKLLHTTGWKLGYVVSSEYFTKEFRKCHQYNVFSVNTPMQMGIAAYLEDNAYYDTLPALFQEKRDFLVEQLSSSRFKVLPTQGTYFMLLDYSNISVESELSFAERLTVESKIAMIPVSSFYSSSDNQHLVRICFAKKLQTLESAVAILQRI